MKLRLSLSTLCVLASAGMRAGDEPVTPPPTKQDPTVAERGYFEKYPQAWNSFHKMFVERAKKGGVDVLFLGDSLTQGWSDAAQKDLWKKYFEPLKAADFGIGGDRTQQILWRIGNGELDGLAPKVVVLMIGVNNLWLNDSPDKIAEGTKKIVEALRQKLPSAKILLLGILPAQKSATDGLRAKIKAVNAATAKLDDGKTVRFLDMGPKFLDASGNIAADKELFQADYLHLRTKGYELWAETMKALLDEAMK